MALTDEHRLQHQRLIAACHCHVRDLLRSAKRLLDDEKIPNIAFQLSIQALEELGKATLIGMRLMALGHDDETSFIDKRLDDHVGKLFWAFWAPHLVRADVSRKGFEEHFGLAHSLHEDRLAAMYVAIDANAREPLFLVSDARARNLLNFAEASLALAEAREWREIDLSKDSDVRWFFESADDVARRALVFGQKSFDKLAELGDFPGWIKWLREQFATADAEAAAAMEAEMSRVLPGPGEPRKDKWRVRVRFYSPSQSFRPAAISKWNNVCEGMKLSKVEGNKSAIDLDLILGHRFSAQQVPLAGYNMASVFLAALNIGSTGLWFWSIAERIDRYCEHIVDLEAPSGMRLDAKILRSPKVEWTTNPIKEAEVNRIAHCMATILFLGPEIDKVISPYLAGVSYIAKTDFNFLGGSQACSLFAVALRSAMQHFGVWDGQQESLITSIGNVVSSLLPTEHIAELTELIMRAGRPNAELSPLTYEDAAKLKVICDVYLIKELRAIAPHASGRGD